MGNGLKTYRIDKVSITVSNLSETVECINSAIKSGLSGYICVSNVYTVWLANRNRDYLSVMDNAMMCLPDGMPLIWLARLGGIKDAQRVNGPDLFMSMLNDEGSDLKHFLLGDTEDTLSALKQKFTHSKIVGTYSPPFCPLEQYDFQEMADRINNSSADVVWVSLKAPKQDFFSQTILPLLDNKICIGVGAAFRFALGEYNHPPKIARKLGLTGIYIRKNKWEIFKWDAKMSIQIMKWGIISIKNRI